MGCRGTIEIIEKDNDPSVFLYTHWGAKEMLPQITTTLKKKERWDDASYLARMIFCEMVKGDEEGNTGYGIQTWRTGDAEEEITVNVEHQWIKQERTYKPSETFTFKELSEE